MENSKGEVKEEKEGIKRTLSDYNVHIYSASNYYGLIQRLKENHFDLAFVDFDLGDTDFRSDAISSAKKIEEYQSSCIRIGFSIDAVVQALSDTSQHFLNNCYHILINRSEVKHSKTLRDKLKEYGF